MAPNTLTNPNGLAAAVAAAVAEGAAESSFSSTVLRWTDVLCRLIHAMFTFPLVALGLLPAAQPLVATPNNYVLVTGASTGIGREAAKALRKAGFSVLAGVRKQKDADAVRADGLVPLIIDVASSDSVEKAKGEVQRILDANPGSRLTAIVANAGVSAGGGPVESMPLESVKDMFEVNVYGAIRTVQAFLPQVRQARGRVILVGSVAGMSTFPFMSAYSMTKHSVESLADGLRQEVGSLGVSVSLLEPGPVATPIFGKIQMDSESNYGTVPNVYKKTVAQADKEVSMMLKVVAVSTAFTSDAILHACVSRFPLYRYRVTWVAYVFAWILSKLPEHVMDMASYRTYQEAQKA